MMTSHDDPSGLSIAEEAHAAGVVEPQEHVVTCSAHMEVTFLCDPQTAMQIMRDLALELHARSDVEFVGHTVSERD